MADTKERELDTQEVEALAQIERDGAALTALIEDLSSSSRRTRQFSARVVAILAQREPKLLDPYVSDLIDALYRPEAQTRWEVLDALSELVPDHAKEIGAAFEGAETALFDELSATLRLSAFHLLCAWGATERGRSKKVWPIIDEAIQCYHGDLEYRDMLGYLHEFAQGKIAGDVAEELAGRLVVAKCNVDENQDISMRYGVMSIPTLVILKNGQEVHRIVGAMPKPKLKEEIERAL